MRDDPSQAEELLFQDVKQLIYTAKRKAATAINKELAILYPSRQSPPDVLIKDPLLLQFLGLCDPHPERDPKTTILRGIEHCLLQLGEAFTSLDVNWQSDLNGHVCEIDLLLFNRRLNRLVAVDFYLQSRPSDYKYSMSQRLRFLADYEQEPHEQPPIGLVLCAGTESMRLEFIGLDDDNTWTGAYPSALPPQELLQSKLHEAVISTCWHMSLAQETLQPRTPGLTSGEVDDAFFEAMSEADLQQWESNPVFPPESHQKPLGH